MPTPSKGPGLFFIGKRAVVILERNLPSLYVVVLVKIGPGIGILLIQDSTTAAMRTDIPFFPTILK